MYKVYLIYYGKKLYSLITLFLISTLLALSAFGCADKLNGNDSKVIVDTRTVEVKVPVKCQIPKIECDFTGDGFTPTEKLLACVKTQKTVIDACVEQLGE